MAVSLKQLSMITIDGCDYYLIEIPADSSSIVVQSTEELKKQLDMQPIVDQLKSLSSFIRVAYVSVIGHTDLQIKVRKIYHKVAELCDQSLLAAGKFQQSSTSAVKYLQTTYKYFMEAHFKAGIITLKHVAKLAGSLEQQAEKLETQCVDDAKEVQEVERDTIEKQGKLRDENTRNAKTRESLESKIETEKGNKERLEEEMLDSKERYRAAATNYEEQRKWLAEQHKSLGFLKTMLNVVTQKVTGYDSYGSGHIVRELKSERDKYEKMIEDQKKERRQVLEKIAKFAADLQACDSTGKDLEDSAILALNRALYALGNISKTFSAFKLYWGQTKSICNDLVGQQEALETIMETDFKSMLDSDTFRTEAIEYYGSWIGLKKISTEFKTNLQIAQREVWNQLVECPTESEAKQAVKSLAKELEDSSRKSIEELDRTNSA